MFLYFIKLKDIDYRILQILLNIAYYELVLKLVIFLNLRVSHNHNWFSKVPALIISLISVLIKLLLMDSAHTEKSKRNYNAREFK
jgi:heme/copper-type cytochrome/quinol oxidase subunit 4